MAQVQTWTQQLDPFTDASGGTVANRSTAAVFDPEQQQHRAVLHSAGTLYELYKVPAGNWYISNLGTPVTSTPTALYDPNNHYMEVYYNSGGALKEKAWNPGGTGWTGVINLAPTMTGSPTAINNPSNTNQQHYFADGGVLARSSWTAASSWTTRYIGGVIEGSPTAVYNPPPATSRSCSTRPASCPSSS